MFLLSLYTCNNFYTSYVHIYILILLFYHSLDNDRGTVERRVLPLVFIVKYSTFHSKLSPAACLYGLGYPRQPSHRDNFTKRLYENCVTETQLTLLNYAYILRRNKHHHLPLFLCSSSFIKYSCVFTFRKWTNTS